MTEAIIPDIPNIKAHWDHPGVDPVPYLMVPMSDRSVIRYNPEIFRTQVRRRHWIISAGCRKCGTVICQMT